MAKNEKDDEIVEYIFKPYITKKGIRIYPKKRQAFQNTNKKEITK